MEEKLFSAFAQLGSSGLLAWILWIIAKRFMDGSDAKHTEIVTQFTSRITALEKSSNECNEDRKLLHKEILSLAKGTATKRKPK